MAGRLTREVADRDLAEFIKVRRNLTAVRDFLIGGERPASPHGPQRQASRRSQRQRARRVCRVALRESAVLYARRGFANIGVTPSKDPTRCDPNFLSENAEDAEQVILCACDFVTNSRGDIYEKPVVSG